jgi:hypothetical protein
MASMLAAVPRSLRAQVGHLLQAVGEPHEETLTLLWPPQFDRAHALHLWGQAMQQQPASAVLPVRALMEVADCFDSLPAGEKQRVRQLVLRHRRRFAGEPA